MIVKMAPDSFEEVPGKKLCLAYSFRTVPSSQKQWSALPVELCVLS